MQLFHTSPNAIINPNKSGRFDEFLFFSDHVYVMTAGEHHVFATEIDENSIIEAGSLWYQENWEEARPFIEELMSRLSIDEDDAMSLLDESASIYDMNVDVELEDMADESWNIQRLTAKCAKALGFVGVEVEDEQGTTYMIDASQIKLESAE